MKPTVSTPRNAIIDQKPRIVDPPGARALSAKSGAVRFRNVGFSYRSDAGAPAIENVTLDAEALNPVSRYVRNIRDIDELVRRRAIPLIDTEAHARPHDTSVVLMLFDELRHAWGARRCTGWSCCSARSSASRVSTRSTR